MANYLALYRVKLKEVSSWDTGYTREESMYRIFQADTPEDARKFFQEEQEVIVKSFASLLKITLERIVEIAQEIDLPENQTLTTPLTTP